MCKKHLTEAFDDVGDCGGNGDGGRNDGGDNGDDFGGGGGVLNYTNWITVHLSFL